MTAPDLALADPAAEDELRRRIAREAYQAGHDDGYDAGYDAGAAAMATQYKRALLGRYRDAQLEAARWTVLCRECRTSGRRDGCTRCEVRDPGTYGKPHKDDYPGQDGAE